MWFGMVVICLYLQPEIFCYAELQGGGCSVAVFIVASYGK